MTSFVHQILSASGKLNENKEDLTTKINRLQKNLDERKADFRRAMQEKYTDFEVTFEATATLCANLESALREVESIETNVKMYLKEAPKASNDLNLLTEKMNELKGSVDVANQIKDIYLALEKSNNFLDEDKICEAAQVLYQVQLNFDLDDDDDRGEDDDEEEDDLRDSDKMKAIESAKNEFVSQMETVNLHLSKEWEKRVKIEVNRLSLDEDLGALIVALDKADLLDFRLSKLALFLNDKVFEAVLKRSVPIKIAQNSIIIPETSDGETPNDQNLTFKIEKLYEIFDLLFGTFSMNIDGKNPLAILGHHCGQKLIRSLLDDCLYPTIPDNREDLERYKADFIDEALDFTSSLLKSGFLTDEVDEMRNFGSDLQIMFDKNRVEIILNEARNLTKLDMFECVESHQHHQIEGIEANPIPELDELSLPDGFYLTDNNLFSFPTCKISKNVLKVITVAQNALNEGMENGSARIMSSAKLVFVLYSSVMPVFHKDSLRTLPLYSALAFNNCMFLAHSCVLMGYEYKSGMSNNDNDNEFLLSFADSIVKLRTVGIDLFQEQLKRQRDQLGAIIEESGLGDSNSASVDNDPAAEEGQLPPKAEQSFKQISHQLNHLKNVWQNVLPLNVFGRSMGVLVNFVIGEISGKVLRLEDISADSATRISSLLNSLEGKLPDLFQVEGESKSSKHDVVRYVRAWQRFKELILVLNANLKEIEDRWAGGKGPLAVEFTVEEMKRLIRALFQNTDRRAAVLSRIKFEK